MINNLDNLDLNIDNYSLDDILNLFKLTHNFTENDIKKTKKVVLMTHPDKSGLDKKFFLFFSSAYKLIYSVYKFKNKDKNNLNRENYEHSDNLKDTLIKFSEQKNFNKKFNELFEKYNYNTEEITDGYGEWLKDNSNDNKVANNKDEMNKIINNKKHRLREIIVKEDLHDVGTGINIQQSTLTGSRPKYYESDVFGKFKYDDLKRAYDESVVPVTEDDYNNRKKYNSVDEYNRFRKTDIINQYNNSNHDKKLNELNNKEIISNTNRAYLLAKQQENYKLQNDNFIHSLLKLKN
jgi:hypothetical protein